MWLRKSNAVFPLKNLLTFQRNHLCGFPSESIHESKGSSSCVLPKSHLFSAGFSPGLFFYWTSCCLTCILGVITVWPQSNAFGILVNISTARCGGQATAADWGSCHNSDNAVYLLFLRSDDLHFKCMLLQMRAKLMHELNWCTTLLHDADQLLNGWLYATVSTHRINWVRS